MKSNNSCFLNFAAIFLNRALIYAKKHNMESLCIMEWQKMFIEGSIVKLVEYFTLIWCQVIGNITLLITMGKV